MEGRGGPQGRVCANTSNGVARCREERGVRIYPFSPPLPPCPGALGWGEIAAPQVGGALPRDTQPGAAGNGAVGGQPPPHSSCLRYIYGSSGQSAAAFRTAG